MDVNELIARNKQAGYSWFNDVEMRGFNTRVGSRVDTETFNGNEVLHIFVTSERESSKFQRRYTVLGMLESGYVFRISQGMQFSSAKQAWSWWSKALPKFKVYATEELSNIPDNKERSYNVPYMAAKRVRADDPKVNGIVRVK